MSEQIITDATGRRNRLVRYARQTACLGDTYHFEFIRAEPEPAKPEPKTCEGCANLWQGKPASCDDCEECTRNPKYAYLADNHKPQVEARVK